MSLSDISSIVRRYVAEETIVFAGIAMDSVPHLRLDMMVSEIPTD
jgi:hypothetical protein